MNHNPTRFALLYGIYIILFFGMCYVVRMELEFNFVMKAIASIAIITLFISMKFGTKQKMKAVMYY
jgi:uncharacterized sodium:solute symporter family permease YidK